MVFLNILINLNYVIKVLSVHDIQASEINNKILFLSIQAMNIKVNF